jgi:hydrogenase nickel incorporation protein HypB
MEIKVLKNIMKRNEDRAAVNRNLFDRFGVLAVNMMSSPGAGKTTILEKTISELQDSLKIAVIEGDLMTSRDAERIHRYGVPVVQINTEGGCHLDANMVNRALEELDLENLNVIIIENVGNLVCPGAFDLGEHFKIVVGSVPEGDDKPEKYPLMFQESKACILNKVDLLEYSNFNEEKFTKDVQSLNPDITIFRMSAISGEGLAEWCQWLKKEVLEVRKLGK